MTAPSSIASSSRRPCGQSCHSEISLRRRMPRPRAFVSPHAYRSRESMTFTARASAKKQSRPSMHSRHAPDCACVTPVRVPSAGFWQEGTREPRKYKVEPLRLNLLASFCRRWTMGCVRSADRAPVPPGD